MDKELSETEYTDMMELLESFRARIDDDRTLEPDEKQLFLNIYNESVTILRELAGVSVGVRPVAEPCLPGSGAAAATAAGSQAGAPAESMPDTATVAVTEAECLTASAGAPLSFTIEDLLIDLETLFMAKMKLALADAVISADEFDDIVNTLNKIRAALDDLPTVSGSERAIIDRICRNGLHMLQGAMKPDAETLGGGRGLPAPLIDSIRELRELETRLSQRLEPISAGAELTDDRRRDIQSLLDRMLELIYEDNVVTPEEQSIMTRVFERTISTYKRALKDIKHTD